LCSFAELVHLALLSLTHLVVRRGRVGVGLGPRPPGGAEPAGRRV
jgi:hypothetical protein